MSESNRAQLHANSHPPTSHIELSILYITLTSVHNWNAPPPLVLPSISVHCLLFFLFLGCLPTRSTSISWNPFSLRVCSWFDSELQLQVQVVCFCLGFLFSFCLVSIPDTWSLLIIIIGSSSSSLAPHHPPHPPHIHTPFPSSSLRHSPSAFYPSS